MIEREDFTGCPIYEVQKFKKCDIFDIFNNYGRYLSLLYFQDEN